MFGHSVKPAEQSSQGSVKVPGVAYLQSYGYFTHERTPHPHDLQNVGEGFFTTLVGL
jgi:hypothetical protein